MARKFQAWLLGLCLSHKSVLFKYSLLTIFPSYPQNMWKTLVLKCFPATDVWFAKNTIIFNWCWYVKQDLNNLVISTYPVHNDWHSWPRKATLGSSIFWLLLCGFGGGGARALCSHDFTEVSNAQPSTWTGHWVPHMAHSEFQSVLEMGLIISHYKTLLLSVAYNFAKL